MPANNFNLDSSQEKISKVTESQSQLNSFANPWLFKHAMYFYDIQPKQKDKYKCTLMLGTLMIIIIDKFKVFAH